MITLKPISVEAIPSALEKAEQYRRLNEPNDAESICLDILAAMPEHQEAMKTLLLALTDKFVEWGLNPSFEQAREIIDKLSSSYSKAYYSGIIFERRAKFHLRKGGPGAGIAAHKWLVKAMDAFKTAMSEYDPKNQDAILRWNSCARIMNANPEIQPEESETREMLLDSFDSPH